MADMGKKVKEAATKAAKDKVSGDKKARAPETQKAARTRP
jgi:hypothetical protein